MRVNFRFLKARSKIRFKLSTTHIYSFDFLELYQQLLGAWCLYYGLFKGKNYFSCLYFISCYLCVFFESLKVNLLPRNSVNIASKLLIGWGSLLGNVLQHILQRFGAVWPVDLTEEVNKSTVDNELEFTTTDKTRCRERYSW